MELKLYSKSIVGDTNTPVTIFQSMWVRKGFLLESRDGTKGIPL